MNRVDGRNVRQSTMGKCEPSFSQRLKKFMFFGLRVWVNTAWAETKILKLLKLKFVRRTSLLASSRVLTVHVVKEKEHFFLFLAKGATTTY